MSRLSSCSLILVLLLIAVGLVGCKQGQPPTNFSHIYNSFKMQPVEQEQTDPAADFSRYHTFTWRRHPDCQDPLTEKFLAHIAIGILQGRGYEYVESGNADLTVSLKYANEYRATSTPSQRVKIPIYDDPESVVATRHEYVTVPGSSSQAFYPEVHVFVYDNERLVSGSREDAVVYTAHCMGASSISDMRLTGQMLLLYVLGFPPRPVDELHGPIMGMVVRSKSPHAGSFYPTIINVDNGSRADKAGLRIDDIIEEVDGHPTADLSYPEAMALLWDWSKDTKVLKIRRLDETFTVEFDLNDGWEEKPPSRTDTHYAAAASNNLTG